MNCATCGNVLPAGGGECTICNPWSTPTSTQGRAPAASGAPIGAPKAPSERMLRARARIINRYPAAAVDMDAAFRRTVWSLVAVVAAFVGAGVLDLVEATGQNGTNQTELFLAVAPLAASSIASRLIVRKSGGWYGAAVSNLGLRTDIGVTWFFNLPEIKRMGRATGSLAFALILLFVIRFTSQPTTLAQLKNLVTITGFFYLAMALVQVALFFLTAVPAFRVVRARLAVPPPANVSVPFPMPAPYGAAPYPHA